MIDEELTEARKWVEKWGGPCYRSPRVWRYLLHALDHIEAQRVEIKRLRSYTSNVTKDALDVENARLHIEVEQLRAQVGGLRLTRDRWVHGEQIESDYLTTDDLDALAGGVSK